MTDTDRTRFSRANDRIAGLVAKPSIAEDVRRFAGERDDANRVYAQGLADIRKASNRTQQQVAAALATDQGTVSRVERNGDMLLSTLRQYLTATGATHPRIVVEKNGVEIALDLDRFA